MKRCVTPRRIIEGDIEGTIKSGVRQWKGVLAGIGRARLPKDRTMKSGNSGIRRDFVYNADRRAEPWSHAGPRLGARLGLTTVCVWWRLSPSIVLLGLSGASPHQIRPAPTEGFRSGNTRMLNKLL
jgi:hypothetical protein